MRVVDSLRPRPGLRVLISAGAAGIGAAIARAFIETGAKVHVCDIDAAACARFTAEVPGVSATVADTAVLADVERVFADVRSQLGGLDVLVNNAGISGPTGGIETLDPVEWERTVAINLNSQFYFLRQAVPLLKASPNDPAVICMSSVAGRLGYGFRTPYAATKWAVVGLMKSIAVELGPQGIRANAILPGPVEGERMNRVIAARAESLGVSFEQMEKEYLAKASLRRMVRVEDVAAMALFLSSPAARNVSGQAISVDGNVEYL